MFKMNNRTKIQKNLHHRNDFINVVCDILGGRKCEIYNDTRVGGSSIKFCTDFTKNELIIIKSLPKVVNIRRAIGDPRYGAIEGYSAGWRV